MRNGMLCCAALIVTVTCASALEHYPAESSGSQNASLDLQQAFHARSPWRLVDTEGTPVKDGGENDSPGALSLCLQRGPTGACLPDAVTPIARAATSDEADTSEPHYLLSTRFVYPRGTRAPPLLMIVTASLHSGNGNQLVSTQLISYDASRDEFQRIYVKHTGRSNNQEVRFIDDGPLRGSVISAEPQSDRPYGYWIVVNTLSRAGNYVEALRYVSSTRYSDGNPLAVIDSEMPTIWKRLGLWKPGQPLPVPAAGRDGKPCDKPTLRHAELWCD